MQMSVGKFRTCCRSLFQMHLNQYLLLLSAAGLMALAYSTRGLRNWKHPGFFAFSLMEFGIAWWIFCYLGEQTGGQRAILWFKLKFIGVCLVAPSWLIFVLHYSRWPLRSRVLRALLYWEWVAFVPLVLSNDSHSLIFDKISLGAEITGINGPFFPVHVFWNYMLLFMATCILVASALKRRVRRRPAGFLIIASFIPWIGSIANELAKSDPYLRSILPLNPTLPAFALNGVAIGWTIFRWHILDPIPVAREHLFETMGDALFVLDANHSIADANAAAAVILRRSQSDLRGSSCVTTFSRWPELTEPILARKYGHVETQMGSAVEGSWFDFRMEPLTGEAGEYLGCLMCGRNITDRKRIEIGLHYIGNHDSLTGLHNRTFFDAEISKIRSGRRFPVGILIFDLDNLKETNDTQGHQAGDDLLRNMADFLRHCFRTDDLVARIGGDEFQVILPSSGETGLRAALQRLERELVDFRAARGIQLFFSVGAALIMSSDLWDAGFQQADQQMYSAKRLRKLRQGHIS